MFRTTPLSITRGTIKRVGSLIESPAKALAAASPLSRATFDGFTWKARQTSRRDSPAGITYSCGSPRRGVECTEESTVESTGPTAIGTGDHPTDATGEKDKTRPSSEQDRRTSILIAKFLTTEGNL